MTAVLLVEKKDVVMVASLVVSTVDLMVASSGLVMVVTSAVEMDVDLVDWKYRIRHHRSTAKKE